MTPPSRRTCQINGTIWPNNRRFKNRQQHSEEKRDYLAATGKLFEQINSKRKRRQIIKFSWADFVP